jgi:hypothetical protein
MISDPRCLRCDVGETMEHLLYGCEHYSANIWALLGRSKSTVILYSNPHPASLASLSRYEGVFW